MLWVTALQEIEEKSISSKNKATSQTEDWDLAYLNDRK